MRHFPKRVSRLVIPLMALLVLVGCGQAGPLYLPDSSPASPPPPVSATPAPAATPPTQ